MGFAVIQYLEPGAEARVQALWQALAEAGISGTMTAAGIRPHITLGGFDGPLPPRLCEELGQLAARTAPLAVTFAGIGVFAGEDVLYLAPVVTMEMLAFHAQLHACLEGLGVAQAEYYLPGHWVPHCTLAIGLPPDKIAGVLDLCRRRGVFAPASIVEIGLVETAPIGPVCSFPLAGGAGPYPSASRSVGP